MSKKVIFLFSKMTLSRCCTSVCPPCNKTCEILLNCKNHNCVEICHPGDCQICSVLMELTCYCGEIREIVPCGILKLYLLPNFSRGKKNSFSFSY